MKYSVQTVEEEFGMWQASQVKGLWWFHFLFLAVRTSLQIKGQWWFHFFPVRHIFYSVCYSHEFASLQDCVLCVRVCLIHILTRDLNLILISYHSEQPLFL